MKKISEFLFENFQFLVVKFSIYLNRCVFVMSGLIIVRKGQHRCVDSKRNDPKYQLHVRYSERIPNLII